MKGKVLSFRRGKTKVVPRHFVLEIEGLDKKEKAKTFIGKEVFWKNTQGTIIKGKIMSTHGNKGHVRAVFERGLPGQAINDSVEIR